MSIHLEAKEGDIAEKVLLPGDPLRAKWIAENFLEEVYCYNKVRAMYGYTGFYKGKKISIQGTGMGLPSLRIYVHELITDYKVKKLIRVGSAGSFQKKLNLKDIVIALAASTNSGINQQFFNIDFAPTVSFELLLKALKKAEELNIQISAGNVFSSDNFYIRKIELYHLLAKFNVLAVEMETSALYTLAAEHKIEALAMLTITDSLFEDEHLSQQEKETSFEKMALLALETI